MRWAEFDPATGELPPATSPTCSSERTRLVAVTGRVQPDRHPARPSPAIAALAHDAGALLLRRRRAPAPRTRRSTCAALGADFYACSPYKFLGPHLRRRSPPARTCWRRSARTSCCRRPTPCPSGSSWAPCPTSCWPGRRRRSTSWPRWRRRRGGSRRERLRRVDGAPWRSTRTSCGRTGGAARASCPASRLWSRAASRTPTLLFTFDGRGGRRRLPLPGRARRQRARRPFYALEASRWLGLGDTGGLRVGLAPYTDAADVDRLLDGPAGVPLGPLTRGQGIPSPGRWPAAGRGRRTIGRTLRGGVQPLVVGRGVAADVQQVVVGGLADHRRRDAGHHGAAAGSACPG